ncbi:tRNA preQ1(34) S-adenosylmethionine ribosyltransferase-isomerase QueA [Candidatus Roizmanbacteria bacterium]|nr:tRNA preQ1(34) S-adenosylmethionine ribosyltransferase-isomerase QueA [Candidatus Roizmanbacteria bacterium]
MIRIEDYEYDLPPGLIARQPAVPRDTSRLFIYDTQKNKITFDYFYNVVNHLPENSFLVLNETKVLPSRVALTKALGGKVNVFFLVNEQMDDPNTMRVMVDRKVKIGDKLFFNKEDSVEVIAQDKHLFTVRIPFGKNRLFQLLEQKGTMPVPLYIKNSPLSRDELRQKYQTIFARQNGSAAAPTASLHFTEDVFMSLKKKNIERFFITLHVGLGTFAPVSEKNISEKKLHEEWYEIPENIFQCNTSLDQEKKRLVAVGTTVVRTLESMSLSLRPSESEGKQSNNKIAAAPSTDAQGPRNDTTFKTDLFIYPPYEFKMVDHLITNFHLPGSSLMMLVEAFLQHKKAKRSLIELYQVAIMEKFRFYSFGDGMLIL